MTFKSFVAIDWSGARGEHLPGIAVACVERGRDAPRLLAPPSGKLWSRADVGSLIADLAREGGALIGADFSFSLPYVDQGGYFPDQEAPRQAPDLWHMIEARCRDEDHLYAGAFVGDSVFSGFFRRPGVMGRNFAPRLRLTEALCRDRGLGPAQSAFNLIGPAQVGLGSLSGMRLLARLRAMAADLAVWPFDSPRAGQSCFVEMYTRLFLSRAGMGAGKVRDIESLNKALHALGSSPFLAPEPRNLTDHETDVIVSAAGMRHMVEKEGSPLWKPVGLSDNVRRTEGWTFGVI